MNRPLFFTALLLLSLLLWQRDVLAADAPAPYGANLFQGNFSKEGKSGQVMPGDRIVLRLWGGSLTVDTTLTVDANGHVAIPEVGDMLAAGLAYDKLTDALRSKLAASGHADSQIYVAPLDNQPVSVFITGNVVRPGRYSGAANDTVLSFLDKAGGIDAQRGSYRRIQLNRGGRTLQEFDLYPFVQRGQLPGVRFMDNDTLVVLDKGPAVSVAGAVRNSALFELRDGQTTGKDLLKLAEPDNTASHIALKGIRNGSPYNTYLPLRELASLPLQDGDSLTFMADNPGSTISVQVQGAVRGARSFPVRRGARLAEVLNFIAVEPGRANIDAIHIKRKSVVQQQKKALADSLRRLEETALTASSSSSEETQIRAKEAEMITKFVDRAKAVEPEGIVVLGRGDKVGDLTLEDGDIIVVPAKSDVVLVNGEVMIPQAMLWNEDNDLADYIKGAGGYNSRADRAHVLVMRQNGSVSGDTDDIRPGDQILVLPKVESKNMQAVKDVSTVLMQVAVSAGTVLGLSSLLN